MTQEIQRHFTGECKILQSHFTGKILLQNPDYSLSKKHLRNTCSVVPHSDTDFCASMFTITLTDSVLLRL